MQNNVEVIIDTRKKLWRELLPSRWCPFLPQALDSLPAKYLEHVCSLKELKSISNHNFLLNTHGRERWVLRIQSADADVLNIDRSQELNLLLQGRSLGLSPQLVYANAACTVMLTNFIDGHHADVFEADAEKSAAPKNNLSASELCNLAQAVAKLHRASDVKEVDIKSSSHSGVTEAFALAAIQPQQQVKELGPKEEQFQKTQDNESDRPQWLDKVSSLHLPSHISSYVSKLRARAVPELVQVAASHALSVIAPYAHANCLCHNDLNPSNVLFKKDSEVVLLDWEYSAFGNPLFDIATVFNGFCLSSAQKSHFFSHYLEPQARPSWCSQHDFFQNEVANAEFLVFYVGWLWTMLHSPEELSLKSQQRRLSEWAVKILS